MAGIIEGKQSVDKLSSKNYSTWKFKLKHLLIAKELWGCVDGSITEPEESALSNYNSNNVDQYFYIILKIY